MKKRNLLVFLLGGMLMVPTAIAADNDGYDDCNQEIHRGPVHMSYVLISYDESIETAFVSFNSAIDEAEILVYQNGMEVDYQVIDATAGMQVPITLSTYGSGEFVIQVKSGSTLLATFNVTL